VLRSVGSFDSIGVLSNLNYQWKYILLPSFAVILVSLQCTMYRLLPFFNTKLLTVLCFTNISCYSSITFLFFWSLCWRFNSCCLLSSVINSDILFKITYYCHLILMSLWCTMYELLSFFNTNHSMFYEHILLFVIKIPVFWSLCWRWNSCCLLSSLINSDILFQN
jgi:hypothetical protein